MYPELDPSLSYSGFAAEVRAGLTKTGQKTLPCQYFYDSIGTALFQAICLLPALVIFIPTGIGNKALAMIAGFFIVMENQYRVGDVVSIAGANGIVVEINLRRTVLRDMDGAVHVVPNGEIRVATNLTHGWSRRR